ncbi:MAG: PspC domain-containing protein [Candidatus Kapabacteria bacterium]|jgi:phage shock protein PspC (stress-responsive transcriptional regulator)|nr:PspC domain-containing protein [Candidatus Kapabacteria bacterium]
MHATLYRRRTQRVFGGVASGIADYLTVDPAFIRLAFVLMVFADGLGLFLYLILLVIVPPQPWSMLIVLERGLGTTPPVPTPQGNPTTVTFVAWSLIAVGSVYLIEEMFPNNDVALPFALMAIGAILLFSHRRNSATILG